MNNSDDLFLDELFPMDKEVNFSVEISPILNNALLFYQTGSTVICSPPVTNTDEDYILFVQEECLVKFYNENFGDNWESKISGYEGCILDCFRNGKYNILVTSNLFYYNIWVTATDIAKKLNLTNKDQRVFLFRTISQYFGFKS
jgi:hypothetical protein